MPLIISHSKRFVFVHIQKCAGSSITNALLPYLTEDDVVYGVHPKFEALSKASRDAGGLWKHSRASEIRAEVGSEAWRDYFTFSFVRNPWDIVVSEYHWWQHTDFDNDQGAGHKIRKMNFQEFVESNFWRRGSCADYLRDGDGLIVDFVGHYESLHSDFSYVCKKLNLPETVLPVTNATKHANFVHYYSPETAAIVAAVYRRDLEYSHPGFWGNEFGYTFPSPTEA